MSKYTTSVYDMVQVYTSEMEGQPIRLRIEAALPKIFDFNFPIYDESHRAELERKIVKRYFNKEIGLETIDLWKLYLDERLNSIMPYYNELYSHAKDLFTNVDVSNLSNEGITGNVKVDSTNGDKTVETTENHDDSTATNSTRSNGGSHDQSTDINSDLPQIQITDVSIYGNQSSTGDLKRNYDDNTDSSGSSMRDSNGRRSIDRSGSDNRTENKTENRNGNSSRKGREGILLAEQMLKYKSTLLNIDNMVVEELRDLFMSVY